MTTLLVRVERGRQRTPALLAYCLARALKGGKQGGMCCVILRCSAVGGSQIDGAGVVEEAIVALADGAQSCVWKRRTCADNFCREFFAEPLTGFVGV